MAKITVDPLTAAPVVDHTPMPSPNAPKPISLEDVPSVRSYIDMKNSMDAQAKKSRGR